MTEQVDFILNKLELSSMELKGLARSRLTTFELSMGRLNSFELAYDSLIEVIEYIASISTSGANGALGTIYEISQKVIELTKEHRGT